MNSITQNSKIQKDIYHMIDTYTHLKYTLRRKKYV